MSKHVTTLPVDIAPVLAALPKRHFLHSIEFAPDKKSIQVIWELDASKTGRTYPVEYPVEKLAAQAPKVIDKKNRLIEAVLWPFQNKS